MVKFTQAQNSANVDSQDQKTDILEILIFIAVNLFAVGISTWQTYIGYKADVGGNKVISAMIALLIMFFYFGLNIGIYQRRKKGEKYGMLIYMYLIPFGMSFFANFNAIYTNQTGKDFLRNEVLSYKSHIDITYNEARYSINETVDINDFTKEYDAILHRLNTEVKGDHKGFGREANKNWHELVDFLNENGGNIKADVINNRPPALRYDIAVSFAKGERDNIVRSMQNKISPTLDAIDKEYTPIDSEIEKTLESNTPVFEDAILNQIQQAEGNIRNNTTAYLRGVGANTDVFTNPPLKPSIESERGTIKYSLHKAFVEKENPIATIFSIFFSVIIDFAALLFIIAITYNKVKGSKDVKYINPLSEI